MVRTALAVLILPLAVAVAAPVPKAVKSKAPVLTGKWEIVELKVGNSDVTAHNPKVLVIDGQTVTAFHRQGDGTLKAWEPSVTLAFVPPDGSEADELDYLRTTGGTTKRLKGRGRVDGDELTFCYADSDSPRPAQLVAGEGVTYERFKRVSDK